MKNDIPALYTQFRARSPFMLKGSNAKLAFDAAKTLSRFRELEAEGLVRMRAEEEQESYFSVFGIPDDERERQKMEEILERDGCWVSIAEYFDGENWQVADSCGMHTGYKNPLDPFENCYVVGEMAAAIKAAETMDNYSI